MQRVLNSCYIQQLPLQGWKVLARGSPPPQPGLIALGDSRGVAMVLHQWNMLEVPTGGNKGLYSRTAESGEGGQCGGWRGRQPGQCTVGCHSLQEPEASCCRTTRQAACQMAAFGCHAHSSWTLKKLCVLLEAKSKKALPTGACQESLQGLACKTLSSGRSLQRPLLKGPRASW